MRTEDMASIRLLTEYGDCLASKSTLAKADTTILNRMAWEGTRRVDWAHVTEQRGCEGIKIAKWIKRYCAGGQPAIPITNSSKATARHLGIPVKELRNGISCSCPRMAHLIFAKWNERPSRQCVQYCSRDDGNTSTVQGIKHIVCDWSMGA